MQAAWRVLVVLTVAANMLVLTFVVNIWRIELRVFNQSAGWWRMPTLLTLAPMLSLVALLLRLRIASD